ncbi:hypothetical protein CCAX7_000170 [Capsulimonas corticalis]|uniref:Uncharacterized protein n=1 Tax=Capsulimonas corticalis TaxID=2219043 RepID=A0A402CRA1_9BACT|nr:RICIN domain-containing protein [Capsulimonas corticalis]BDI27966.1 hypothetical protein CCAX7_000170 [Capsulimonas corticalis]
MKQDRQGYAASAQRRLRVWAWLGAVAGLAALAPADAQSSRDPWLQPFAASSIWNTPIGSGASYTSITLGQFGDLLHDQEYLIQENPNDPLRKIAQPGNANAYFNIHVADGWFPEPYNLPYHTPNNCAAFLEPDGVSLYQFTPLRRDDGAGNGYTTGDLTGFYFNGNDGPEYLSTSLYGPGNGGEHAGSGLSCLGGDIRKGEITDNNLSNPIKHAIKIELDWDQLYRNSSDSTNRNQTFRWPATTSDAGYAGYLGGNSALRMGSLLAVPSSATESTLGLQTVPGKKLFHALQDFGGYVVDTSAANNFRPNGGHRLNICFENGVETDFQSAYGYALDSGTATGTAWYSDVRAIYGALKVVDNNTAASIGGGGTPRASTLPLNYAINPSFEYNHAAVSAPLDWSKYSPNGSGDYNACYTENLGVAHRGSYQMACYRSSAYSIQPYQLIANLPNGTYTLKAWVQSSGGLSTANMYAWRYADPNGGAVLTAGIPATGSGSGDWVQISISGIPVSDGECEIGFQIAGAGQWVRMDDIELYQSGPVSANIANGVYALTPQCATACRLDDSGGGTTAGSNVQIWTSNGLNPQRWSFARQSDGYYKITCQQGSGLCLDVNGSGTTNGTNVQIYTDNGGNAQRWLVTDTGSGTYKLTPKCAPGMCLDVNAASSTPGANVQIWTDNGSSAQRWTIAAN